MTTGAGTMTLPIATDRFYTTPARTKDFGLVAENVTPVGGEAQSYKVPSPNYS